MLDFKKFKKPSKEDQKDELVKTMAVIAKKNNVADISDKDQLKNIVFELASVTKIENAVFQGGGMERDRDLLQLKYQKAIIEQNFLIIKLLDELNKKIR